MVVLRKMLELSCGISWQLHGGLKLQGAFR
jgi:hypothetical protein